MDCKDKEAYKRAIGYYICMFCEGDLEPPWVQGICESCACKFNKDFEEIKRLEKDARNKGLWEQ